MTPHQLRELLPQKPYLLDVRDPDELRDLLPPDGSHNIPMQLILQAMQLSPDEFRERFGFERFSTHDRIVVICLSGARSMRVAQFLRQHGLDAHNLDGGLLAWRPSA